MSKELIYKIIRYFISLLFISLLFNYFNGFLMNNLITNIIICLLTSLIFSLIDIIIPKGKWLSFIILAFIAIYAIVQTNFIEFMGNYISFVQATDGANRITDYIIQFIAYIKLPYYLLLLPLPFNIYFNLKNKEVNKKQVKYSLILLLMAIALCISNPLTYYSSIEKNLATNGLIPFLIMDIYHVFNNKNVEEEIIIEPIVEETIIPEEIVNEEKHRIIDDTMWNNLIAEESDESILNIDNFLKSKPISDYNDYTGIFEGKNLIMIMIEAFDYMAIDEQLTPTLYKMKTEGWFWNNYYTPKYSCTTGESEFISITSLVPENNTCAPNDYKNNTYPGNVFNLFNQKGYYTSAYHNWKDEFYERRKLCANMGCENYYNYDDLEYSYHPGWPSDVELFDYSYELFKDKAPFMSLIVTSSTHFPYDQSSWSADLNLDRINEVHPDYPLNVKRYLSKAMILDEGLNHLLTNLENDGILDDTIIIMYADHHPLKTDYSTINTYSNSGYDRLAYDLAIDRSPLIIYGGNIEKTTYTNVMSTFDILPTLANLFDLTYDPRYYAGMDYFAPEENIVIFANGSWIINDGYYSNIKETYTSFNETTLSEEKIKYYNTIVQNNINASSKILRKNYFKNRDFPITYKN